MTVVTHEQSLLTCAAYRALASDGRFRRLWMVAALRVAGLKGLRLSSALLLLSGMDSDTFSCVEQRL